MRLPTPRLAYINSVSGVSPPVEKNSTMRVPGYAPAVPRRQGLMLKTGGYVVKHLNLSVASERIERLGASLGRFHAVSYAVAVA